MLTQANRNAPGGESFADAAYNLAGAQERVAQAINAKTLRELDFRKIQDNFVQIARKDGLMGAVDLRAAGLVVPEDIGTIIVGDHDVSEMTPARRNIHPTKRDSDETVFRLQQTVLPIIDKTFQIKFRDKGFGYKEEQGVNAAQYQLLLSLDDMIFNGDPNITVVLDTGTITIHGYTTLPNRATETISDWSSATTNVLANVLQLTGAMVNTNEIAATANSLVLYLPFSWWTPLKGQAFAAKGSNSFLKQILEDNPEISKIQPTDRLTDEIVLVAMRSDKVQLVEAQAPIVAPDMRNGLLSPYDYTAWTAAVPFLKQDSNNKTGVVHGSL